MSKPIHRQFNKLYINKETVLKTSSQTAKLVDEIFWYQKLPNHLKKYIPKIIDSCISIPFIELEYCGPDFGTLFCKDKNINWELYFNKILTCIKSLHSNKRQEPQVKKLQTLMYKNKTLDRILDYNNEKFSMYFNDLELNSKQMKGISHLLENLDNIVKTLVSDEWTAIHGDMFLGNILKDHNDIKLIDPRGSFGGQKGTFGDPKYDWAKLAHCLFYNYSLIVHDKVKLIDDFNYQLNITEEQIKNQKLMQEMFIKHCPYDKKTIDMMVALLFISMIPLHSENYERQKILLITGLEAYNNAIC